MTRQHSAGYTPAHDPYAAHRCGCNHLVYPGLASGSTGCPWAHLGCTCTDHKPKAVSGNG